MRANTELKEKTAQGFAASARLFILFLAALFTAFGVMSPAQAETRSLRIYHVHSGEKAEITFKRNGVYLTDGLRKLNFILRDWRRNEPTKMDPKLFDAVWEVYQKTGSRGYISVVGGYRSAATNSMLRKRSKGVAEKSQHIRGKAMDFFIPGVSLKKLRYLGLQRQAGGVGYYPRSGSPFVHFDVGSVRHWPKMSRSELMAVFPSGKTIHVPSDGRPLAGYQVAMASYKSGQRNGVAKFAAGGGDDSGTGVKRKSLLAALFGGGADEEEDNNAADEPAVAVKPKPAKPVIEAKPVEKPVAPKPEAKEVLVAALPQRTKPAPLAVMRPSEDVQAAEPVVETEALAFAVPVPSKRPRANPVLAAPSAEAALAARLEPKAEIPVQLASVDPEAERDAIRAALGAKEPVTKETAAETVAADAPFFDGSVPLPASKPQRNEQNADDAFLIAVVAVPQPRPVAEIAPAVAEAAEAPVQVASAAPAEEADELRKLLTENNNIDPSTVADPGVTTTDKASKPRAADAKKKARKPVAVPVTEDLGKFALTKEPVTTNGKEVVALTYDQASVWNAPTEVYVAGFSADAPQNVNKFSGKAVNFLKVAKFKKRN